MSKRVGANKREAKLWPRRAPTGIGKGLLGLGIFLAGLVAMNFVICASGLLSASSDRPRLHRILSGAAAAFS